MTLRSKQSSARTNSSVLRRRVVKDQDKAAKKIELTHIAAKILNKIDYSDLSIERVATDAGLAKGTLYLYFKTKEEIALAVLQNEYLSWFKDFGQAIDGEIKRKSELVPWILRSLKNRKRFLKLIPLGTSLLETKVTEEAIIEYKLETYKAFTETSLRLSRFLKKDPHACSMILVRIHVAVVGSLAHGFQVPEVKKVIQEHKLVGFDTDYFEVLAWALEGVF